MRMPRHKESGRAAISKGCLKRAKQLAERNVRMLKDIVTDEAPLVGVEPSCILSFRDEYPDLVPAEMREKAKELGRRSLLFDEFLLQEIKAGRISRDRFEQTPIEIFLHGHCHQKALVGVEVMAEVLRSLLNATVHVIPSGCCGMAGSFGYEKEHYKTSLAIGEMILFPAIRKATLRPQTSDLRPPTYVLAPGTSCRQQILDGTGVKAVHPIEILYKSITV
jgi:Fe-S oxidoreductase